MTGSNTQIAAPLAFVISTLGRTELLAILLTSLQGQLLPGDQVVVVAQGNVCEVQTLCASFPALPLTVATSAKGASRGRNLGVGLLPAGDFVLHFPNDSTWFPDHVVAGMRDAASREGFRMGCATVLDDRGLPKRVLPPEGAPLTQLNAWQVLEAGILIRRGEFERLGGFDVSLGSGADTPWQSGEGTDLVLRALAGSPPLTHAFVWLPRTVALGGVAEDHGLTTAARRRKLRAYGRGLGRVAQLHRYPLGWRLARLLKGLASGARRKDGRDPTDGLWVFVGRFEGMLGRVFGRGDQRAVTR